MKGVWICQGCGRAAVTEAWDVLPEICPNARCPAVPGTLPTHWVRAGNNAADEKQPDPPQPEVEITGIADCPLPLVLEPEQATRSVWVSVLVEEIAKRYAPALMDSEWSAKELWDMVEDLHAEGVRRGHLA